MKDGIGVAVRMRVFIAAMIANGGDRKAAAIEAGYAAKCAGTIGSRLAKRPEVIEALRAERDRIAAKMTLKAENVLEEIAGIVHFDVRRLFGPDGELKAIVDMDDATARAISSIKVSRSKERGETIIEIKACDKNTAIGNAMKHLGLFERDHVQQADAMAGLMAHVLAHNEALRVADTCKPLSLTPRPGTPSGGASATSTGS